jgi:hypothetical protein
VLREPDGTFAIDDTFELRMMIRNDKVTWGSSYGAGLMMDAKVRVR